MKNISIAIYLKAYDLHLLRCNVKFVLFAFQFPAVRLVVDVWMPCTNTQYSMEFLKPKGQGNAKLKQQLLTVGDAAGNLHVYDVPQNLWRPLANERTIMYHFLERERKVSNLVISPQLIIA